MKCNHCYSNNIKYSVKIILTNRQDSYYPKYIPQIKAVCADCDKFIKFAPQTLELIEAINKKIATNEFVLSFDNKYGAMNQTEFSDWLNK